MLNARELWDVCKNRIRTFSIVFSKKCKKENDLKTKNLEQKLKSTYYKMILDPNNIILVNEYNKIKLEYELIYSHYINGLIIRSKAKWIEEGEKCSKYFLNLEKRNISNKRITELIDAEGKLVKTQEDLIQTQTKYYENLYKDSGNISEELYESFVYDVNLKTLSNDSKVSCEGLLDINECKCSLDKMKNGKSPGSYGLTAEFYKYHWNLVGQLVVNSFN